MNNDFIKELKQINIDLTNDLQSKFEAFYNLLIEENKITNLTRITDKEEVYYLHFYDSLYSSTLMNINDGNDIKVLDIGSGPGFPGLPLAITFDNLKITTIDAVNKKINFQNKVIKALNLKNIKPIHSRIEDFKEYESFDFVVSRALSSLNKQLDLSLPFLKVGGKLIAYKGSLKAEEELNEANELINKLNGKVASRVKYQVLDRSYELIVIEKTAKTPLLSKKIKESDTISINEGDIFELKKKHPCGETKFEVIKKGTDCKIKCLGCGRVLLLDRVLLKKSIKRRISSTQIS